MRLRGALALAVAVLVGGCGGGELFGFGKKPAPPSADSEQLISKPKGPGLVDRCPVPVAYDDATEKKIQAAIDALPPDNVLRQAMTDYETERDNLRMCH